MAIDLLALRAYTEGIDIDDLRLVHLTESGGGPGWGLMTRDGTRLSRWLPLGAGDEADAVEIIEVVGLMPLRTEEPPGDEQDLVFVLQPGSAQALDGTPVSPVGPA